VIVLAGVPITGLPPHARARLGVSRTFQNIRLFGELTVRESVRVARSARTRAGVLAALARTPAMRRERRSADLAVSALATEPQLLLLDEPAGGMSLGEAAELMELIRTEGLTLLLVEHHIRVVMPSPTAWPFSTTAS
jgi:branched-chain amino acid transport system ATP-binding protein